MLGMPADTINRDTQEWERIESAVAFRMPEGNELLIMRSVPCPACSKPLALVLGDGTTIGYSRRHAQCGLEKLSHGEPGLTPEELDKEENDG